MLKVIIITIAIIVGGLILLGLTGAVVYILTQPLVRIILTKSIVERLHPDNVWPLSILLSIIAPLGIIPAYYFSFRVIVKLSGGKNVLLFIAILLVWCILSSVILHLFFITKKNEHFVSLCSSGEIEKINFFLKKNKDINYLSGRGFTPLNEAVKSNNIEVVKLLLSHGADVNKTADYGLTPLHIAAKGNNTEMIRLLIEANAELDKLDAIGNTPLITACKYGNSGAARLFIESNANTKLTDRNGISALSAAENNGLNEIVFLLKKA